MPLGVVAGDAAASKDHAALLEVAFQLLAVGGHTLEDGSHAAAPALRACGTSSVLVGHRIPPIPRGGAPSSKVSCGFHSKSEDMRAVSVKADMLPTPREIPFPKLARGVRACRSSLPARKSSINTARVVMRCTSGTVSAGRSSHFSIGAEHPAPSNNEALSQLLGQSVSAKHPTDIMSIS